MKESIQKIRKLRKNRPIRAKFTREMAEDLKSLQGLDVSQLLEDSLVEELKKEIPLKEKIQRIRDLRKNKISIKKLFFRNGIGSSRN